MKKYRYLLVLLCLSCAALAQDQKSYMQLYRPDADAEQDIQQAVAQAKREGKHVMLQIGGNWCIWCKYFHELVTNNDRLHAQMNQSYVVVHVNYDKKDKDLPLWERLGYPQRFGFPVFVILNGKGERIHTQNSAYLEEGKGHSVEKVAEFLGHWSPEAVSGATIK